jgi:hypothetical protein
MYENRVSAALSSVGRLPGSAERPPIIKLKQKTVRVIEASFFANGRIPEVGTILTMDADDAAGLLQRKLVAEAA